MNDDWKTPRQPELIGHLKDASGNSVAISVDRNEVLIRQHGIDIRLGPAERDLFPPLYFAAETEADTWRRGIEGPVS